MPRTVFDKLWDMHLVRAFADGSALLALDRIFLHERTGSLALNHVLDTGRRVAAPQRVFGVMDHVIDTVPGRTDRTMMPGGTEFIAALRRATGRAGTHLFDIDHPDQGISHVVAAELGLVLPGYTYVCPDSHSCTLGALGALAWGIGTSDCEQAVATQMLRVVKPAQTRVRIEGQLPAGTTAKDLALYIIARFGAAGGARHAIEYTGPAVSSLDMAGRFTLCNMAVEFSAFTAVIAPDATTLAYVRDRRSAPQGAEYAAAATAWSALASDAGAEFARELHIDASVVGPMVSWGTALEHTVPVDGVVPAPESFSGERRDRAERALEYMGLAAGAPIAGHPIDAAFIGSCTNGRLADLRSAAAVLRGRRVAPGVRALCVPASQAVKRAAEAEGLHEVFVDAGFEWREPGCSLCFHAGGEGFEPGQRVISSTNRNFEGRQGPRVRTHVASPAMVAASAVTGVITDPRPLQR